MEDAIGTYGEGGLTVGAGLIVRLPLGPRKPKNRKPKSNKDPFKFDNSLPFGMIALEEANTLPIFIASAIEENIKKRKELEDEKEKKEAEKRFKEWLDNIRRLRQKAKQSQGGYYVPSKSEMGISNDDNFVGSFGSAQYQNNSHSILGINKSSGTAFTSYYQSRFSSFFRMNSQYSYTK